MSDTQFKTQHSKLKTGLSVAIIARDEEHHIGDAVRSVQGLASEVLVLLDSRSQDATAQICRDLGARVEVEPWQNFSVQRNLALAHCHTEWLLFLDADERVTPELFAEIGQLLFGGQGSEVGYWIPRHNLFFGQIVRGGGWYPDHQLRLLRCAYAHYDETRIVHELAVLDGQAGFLNGHLLHLNIEDMDELWHKQRGYAIQEAQTLLLAGRQARWRNLLGAPLREFYRRFVQLGGWRDGRLGLLLCGTLAFFEFVKYVRVLALRKVVRHETAANLTI